MALRARIANGHGVSGQPLYFEETFGDYLKIFSLRYKKFAKFMDNGKF